MINFYKYQGTGNDFILIDNFAHQFSGDKVSFVKKWCDRKFGIGADGLIFLEDSEKADFMMDFYNPDGSQSFCGNGSRCVVAFAKDLGYLNGKNSLFFEAIDGLHEAEVLDDTIKIAMHQYGQIEEINEDHFIDTGSPHYVSYKQGNPIDIVEFGKKIRYNERFKEKGTNVNVIDVLDENHIEIWTYERGVEDETLACGTGATACGISFAAKNKMNRGVVHVKAQGGNLKIHVEREEGQKMYKNIWLEGPATFVFKGEMNA
jgi:diaminopimelate epimerase